MALGNMAAQLLSPSRWRKVRLLVMEQWLRTKYRLKGESRRAGSDEGGLEPATDLTPVIHRWHYRGAIPMSRELFESSTDRYHQDNWHDGVMSAELDYAVVEVPHGCVVTNEINHRSTYDGNDKLIPEVSYSFGRHRPDPDRPVAVTREVPGLTVSLYGNVAMAGGNYGHWMVDGLSRLFLIEKHYSMADVDHVLVPPLKYDFHRESLLALGIKPHQIIEIKALECIRFERLVLSSPPRGTSSSIAPGWMIDGFRDRLLPQFPPTRRDRRLYISRRDAGSRNFDNEDDITALLERHGFEIIELSKYGFEGKLKLFIEADIVIGLSGAGLTNVMFCPREATLIELQPSSLSAYLFSAAAIYLGMNSRYILFDSQSLASKINRYYGDLHLDPALIEEQLQQIEADRKNR